MINYLRRVSHLSFTLARSRFKLKNEETWLGLLWYLPGPILKFSLLFLIFSDRLGSNIEGYEIYLFLGIIMFDFFQKSTAESGMVIRSNKGIIRSINFPKEALIGGVVIQALFTHLFEIILFIILLLILKISLIGIVYYLILLLFFALFVFGLCLILSSLTVYFMDLKNIWGFASGLIWFATPIFYAIEGQTRLFYLNLFNPMYYFITIARGFFIDPKVPELWMVLGIVGYSFLFLFIGLLIFNKLKVRFAEMV